MDSNAHVRKPQEYNLTLSTKFALNLVSFYVSEATN